ncbi:Similar to S.cerevisiae protein BNA3 (Kynurenine aminotransferase) [Malassezia sympodialis ATCC 42132]|uniref:Similar to S.cerevisiae protein BNA3 (Kynurenine aminotransferase) n=2 Tax=Malassezia sympodialis (strain ATCC 42132) TaxID=1230383 RepID=A0A1M8A071_MALS4|nr:Similar to S.cerevisiae protein BNA3 (Kynurenine aminotransferase) [Malassezia sympodialis ATCC 42132]
MRCRGRPPGWRTITTMTQKPTRFLSQPASRMHEELNRGTDVWTFFNQGVFPTAVNLGQGFMNWKPPSFLLDRLLEETKERVDLHHYSPARGRPRLLNAISDTYSASFHKPAAGNTDMLDGKVDLDTTGLPMQRPQSGEKLDPMSEIVVTPGANEAMYSAATAFLEEGDEVILLEPFFDQYVCETTFNGGVPVYVPMLPPSSGKQAVSANEWLFDWDLLEQKMASPRAKLLFLNTPHNPIGKVCTLKELQQLAALCIKYDILVISDEVYDCLTYDQQEHIRLASISGMWERTITVGSAGKSFACTGWRVGWAIGPKHLITPTMMAHLRITYTTNSIASEGAALGLELADQENFFEKQRQEYAARRQELMAALDHLGLPYTIPHGSYFVLVDASNIRLPDDFEMPDEVRVKARDYHVCWFIGHLCDVIVLPATAFYAEQDAKYGERFIRFAFCKDHQLGEAARRLEKLRPYLTQTREE